MIYTMSYQAFRHYRNELKMEMPEILDSVNRSFGLSGKITRIKFE